MNTDQYILTIGDAEEYLVEADFSQASSPILLDGQGTPFQVADSQHSVPIAATLLYGWLQSEGALRGFDGEPSYEIEPVDEEPTESSEAKPKITDTDDVYIDITEHFSAESWDSGNGPLTSSFLDEHGLTDVTRDDRWFSEFETGNRLGVYLGSDDQYYIVENREAEKTIELVRIGDEDDLLAELGLDENEDDETKALIERLSDLSVEAIDISHGIYEDTIRVIDEIHDGEHTHDEAEELLADLQDRLNDARYWTFED